MKNEIFVLLYVKKLCFVIFSSGKFINRITNNERGIDLILFN